MSANAAGGVFFLPHKFWTSMYILVRSMNCAIVVGSRPSSTHRRCSPNREFGSLRRHKRQGCPRGVPKLHHFSPIHGKASCEAVQTVSPSPENDTRVPKLGNHPPTQPGRDLTFRVGSQFWARGWIFMEDWIEKSQQVRSVNKKNPNKPKIESDQLSIRKAHTAERGVFEFQRICTKWKQLWSQSLQLKTSKPTSQKKAPPPQVKSLDPPPSKK